MDTTSRLPQAQPLTDEPRQRDYRNFVVLGHARCGSNLLTRALGLHPQIRMAGEVLANDDATRKEVWERINPAAWSYPRGDHYRAGQDAAAFLDRRIFSTAPFENIHAFGFKLFYNNARDNDAAASAWDYLIAHDISIIHIVRRNLLATYVSREVATRTNVWLRPIEVESPAQPPVPPFAVNPAALASYFDSITSWRDWADKAFSNHTGLRITYEEDLCHNFDATVQTIFKLLGVIPLRSRPMLKKQQTLPLHEQISNFEQLRQHFHNSPYAEFFEPG